MGFAQCSSYIAKVDLSSDGYFTSSSALMGENLMRIDMRAPLTPTDRLIAPPAEDAVYVFAGEVDEALFPDGYLSMTDSSCSAQFVPTSTMYLARISPLALSVTGLALLPQAAFGFHSMIDWSSYSYGAPCYELKLQFSHAGVYPQDLAVAPDGLALTFSAFDNRRGSSHLPTAVMYRIEVPAAAYVETDVFFLAAIDGVPPDETAVGCQHVTRAVPDGWLLAEGCV
eukprot:tig00021042_g17598.t1